MMRSTQNSAKKKTTIEEIRVSSEHQGPVVSSFITASGLETCCDELARFIAWNKLVLGFAKGLGNPSL